MHEFPIARDIVAAVIERLPSGVSRGVRSIRLKVGVLNRFRPDSLSFCFEVASHGTAVQGATLQIEEIAGDDIQVVEFDLDQEAFG